MRRADSGKIGGFVLSGFRFASAAALPFGFACGEAICLRRSPLRSGSLRSIPFSGLGRLQNKAEIKLAELTASPILALSSGLPPPNPTQKGHSHEAQRPVCFWPDLPVPHCFD
jgi:hypothetical protein